jgi:hypothetical protein
LENDTGIEVCPENFARKPYLFYSSVTDAVYWYCMRCYPKVPEMYQKKKKVDMLKVLIATVPFKVVPLGAYTTIPTFLPRSDAALEVLLCKHLL